MYSLVIHTYSENQRLTFSLSLTHSLAPPLKQGGKGNIIICHERKTRRATSIYDRVLVRFLSYLHPLRYGTKKKNKTKPFPRIVSIKAGAIMMLIFLSLRKRRRRANYFVKKKLFPSNRDPTNPLLQIQSIFKCTRSKVHVLSALTYCLHVLF